ncbi:MAG: hypothetical protein KC621_29675, partial [Myxococcales bacterium]|nr:hypothetical protein [Myxococcales bacterium]
DVYEELAKSIGYENFTPSLPPIPMGSVASVEEVARQRTDEVLVGYGFYEVFTDGFYGRNALDLLGIPEGHPLFRHVETTNALDRAYSLLKNNCLHQALLTIASNERRRVPDVRMFEWTRTFHPVEGLLPDRADPRRPPCVERPLMWLVASGRDRPRAWHDTSRRADLAWLRGIVHELSVELGIDLEVGEADREHPLFGLLHPNRRQGIVSGGRTVGILGEPHPAVSRRYKLKQATPVYLEIDADALLVEGTRPAWSDPPSVQPVVRSLAFGLPRGVEAGDIAAVLHANGPDWLEHVLIVDLFRLEPASPQEPDRAITYELRFEGAGADDEPRTAEEINAAVVAMVAVVSEQFGPMGVRQR